LILFLPTCKVTPAGLDMTVACWLTRPWSRVNPIYFVFFTTATLVASAIMYHVRPSP
jgi:hypothetical protein